MPDKVIVDTSVLIALDKINLLEVLCKIYGEIILPEGLALEFGNIDLNCYKSVKVDNPLINVLTNDLNLGRGESEVIALAYESKNRALIDDLRARKIALQLGIVFSGSIGVLLRAEKSGFIDSAYKKALELSNKGFYISDGIIEDMKKQ
jgi:hypothetical protein